MKIETLITLAVFLSTINITYKNTKYRLIKENSFSNYSAFGKPNIYGTIRNKVNSTNITKDMQQVINKIYSSFEPVVTDETMKIIRRNIESVKVNSSLLDSIYLSLISAGGAS